MNVACEALKLVDFSIADNSGYITLYRAEGEVVDREELSDFNKQSAGTWFSPKKEEALRYASAVKRRRVYKVSIPNSFYAGLSEIAKDKIEMSKGEVQLPIEIAEKKEPLTGLNEDEIDKNPYKNWIISNRIKSGQVTQEQIKQVKELYSKYLDTIFPESKVKDIVWHGSRSEERFENFDSQKIGDLDGGFFGKGFYFSEHKELAETYRSMRKNSNGSLYAIKLNLKNPYMWKDNQKNFLYINKIDLKNTPKGDILIDKDFEDDWVEELTKRYNEKYSDKIESVDSIEYADELNKLASIGTDFLKDRGYDGSIAVNPISKQKEFVAFDESEIHILGSRKDIEYFRNFVSKKE